MQILTEAFLQALNMSFTAGIVILCVCLARLLLRRAPAVLRYALWAVVLFRLLCPVSFESALALLPTDPAPVGTEILYAAQPEVHTGIAPVDGAVNESLPAAEPAHSVNPLQIASAVGAAVWAVYGLLYRFLGNTLSALGAIGVGVAVYFVLVVALHAISKDDLSLMPKGEKIAKILRL